jgi:hypothetical protein
MSEGNVVPIQEVKSYRVWRTVRTVSDEYAVIAASSPEEAREMLIAEVGLGDDSKLSWAIHGVTERDDFADSGVEDANEPLR